MKLLIILSTTLMLSNLYSQPMPRTYRLNENMQEARPSDNSTSWILVRNRNVYLSTAKGLNVTTDGGRTFQTKWGTDGPTDVSAGTVAVNGDTIVVAAFSPDTSIAGTDTQVGGGLYVSTDNGASWIKEPQSIDDTTLAKTVIFGKDTLKALPWPTDVENATFSLCFYHGYLYTANWAGGLRRSPDLGKTWQRMVLPPDNLDYITQDSTYNFQLSVEMSRITTEANFNQEAFSVYSDGDSALYVGTAGGINKTTDDGYSWDKFSHQNQQNPISGDWVVSLAGNNYGGNHYIWGATVNANDPNEVEALSYTTDGGASWHSILHGHRFNAMAFQDSILYGASDDGLFRTADIGAQTQVITNVYDEQTRQSVLSQEFYAVATIDDSVWLGSPDGTSMGIDNGNGFDPSSWHVFRTYVPLVSNSGSTYFYPNPFSPNLDIGRIHYYIGNSGSRITIRIFDFSMHIVKTLLQNATRPTGETDERWNGTGDHGDFVDNGIYFYSVAVNGGAPAWGKILVVR